MFLKKGQLPILLANLAYLTIASIVYASRKNYEFVIYIGVIVLMFALIILTNKKVNYPNFVLWGLTFWGILHMAGGMIMLKGGTMRLYELILIPLSKEYEIFRYDQFVHIIGFGVATLAMFTLIKPHLKENLSGWVSIGIVTIMAGLGVGAFNEIIEFLAVVFVPETGVGGYVNSSLDLVSNFVGAILAFLFIWIRKGNLNSDSA